MRVLLVAPNVRVPGTHGGSTHVTEVLTTLGRRHQVMLLARRGSKSELEGSQIVPIGIGTLPGPLSLLPPLVTFPSAIGPARRFAPDVIYERASAGALGVMLGAALGVPVVSMVLDENVSWVSLRGARRIVATAPHLVPARYRDKLERVSWGANVDRFHPGVDGASVRRLLGFSPDDVVVGYSGAFYPWHGLETLVDAAGLVLHDPRGQRVRYLLVGDGKLRGAIEQRIVERDLSMRFRFTGRVSYEEVPRYIAACDLCVAPFDPGRDPVMRKHGMSLDPLKVFEYLASGKPTITIDSANLLGLFEDRKHLLLAAPGDAGRLAAMIGELATDPELRARLGRAGRAVTVERYSWQAHADQLERVFETVVAGTARTPARSVG